MARPGVHIDPAAHAARHTVEHFEPPQPAGSRGRDCLADARARPRRELLTTQAQLVELPAKLHQRAPHARVRHEQVAAVSHREHRHFAVPAELQHRLQIGA